MARSLLQHGCGNHSSARYLSLGYHSDEVNDVSWSFAGAYLYHNGRTTGGGYLTSMALETLLALETSAQGITLNKSATPYSDDGLRLLAFRRS